MEAIVAWICDSAIVGALAGFLYWLLVQPELDQFLWATVPTAILVGAYLVFLSGMKTPGRRIASRFAKPPRR